MVTKLTKTIDANPFKSMNVRGYESAMLVLDITAITGTSTFSIYTSPDNSPESFIPIAYLNGELLSQPFQVTKAGKYIIYLDLSDVNKIRINKSGATFSGTTVFSTSFQKLEDSVKHKPNIEGRLVGGEQLEIKKNKNSKQIDLKIKVEKTSSSHFRVEGSNDDFVTVTPIQLIDTYNKTYIPNGYIDTSSVKYAEIYANIESYERVRVRLDSGIANLQYTVSDSYVDERVIPNISFVSSLWSSLLFKGYKCILYDVSGTQIKDTSYRCNISAERENGSSIAKSILKKDLSFYSDYTSANTDAVELYGSVKSGGFFVLFDETITKLFEAFNAHTSLAGGSSTTVVSRKLYVDKPIVNKQETTVKECNDYSIKQLPTKATTKDVYNYDVVEFTSNNITMYMGGYEGIVYSIDFNEANCPSIKNGEQIKFAYLLPYNYKYRGDQVGSERFPSRIVLFTNKNRVLHNFPVRSGNKPNSDMFKFDESAVYNMSAKHYYTNDKSKADSKHIYFPVLKDYDYNQFEGRVNGTTGFVDYFGNGGIIENDIYPLLDFKIKDKSLLSRLAYSNLTRSPKMCVFGNYNSVDGEEPFAMATNDGGRTWYIQKMFACTDNYNYMRSGNIDLSILGNYTASSIKMCCKRFNYPTEAVKEPKTPFVIKEEEKSLVSSFTVEKGVTIVNLASDIDLVGLNPIVYFENISSTGDWQYICNNGFNAAGTINNGVFFRVEKIDNRRYKLYGDLGNPYESDAVCRHIHAVNSVPAGVMISTGESYSTECQGGFIYLLEQNMKNGGNAININRPFKLIRLTSSPFGVNRACGAYMFDDDFDPTIIYASDEAFETVDKRYFPIPDRSVVVKNIPAGIFIGKLSKIDSQKDWKCICPINSTIVSLVHNQGHFAADGHEDCLLISRDGMSWSIETNDVNNKINGIDNDGNIYYGDKVIVFK